MNTRSGTVALGIATFAITAVLLVVATVRTVIFSIWAGVLGAYVTADPPANIYVLWSSVITLGWTLLVLPMLFAGLLQMVRYRPSGRYLVTVACAVATLGGLYTGIRWGLDWQWAFLLVIPVTTMVLALLPDHSLDTGA